MSKSNTGPSYCKLCETNHWQRDGCNFKDEPTPKKIVATLKKKVATMSTQEPVKRVHKPNKRVQDTPQVYTIRKVGMRRLRSSFASELKDLPFDIVKNGIVIARVEKAKA